MHLCIVGTGATGWIAANYYKNQNFIDKITVIGSSKIPPIGVGESNVSILNKFLSILVENNEFSYPEFICETDAAMKYGVMYEGWCDKEFLHYFKLPAEVDRFSFSQFSLSSFGRSLANKDPNTYIHDIMGRDVYDSVKKNNIMLDQNIYEHSYHFDAGKFIKFFSKIALNNIKVSYIDDEVITGQKINDEISFITTKENGNIEADFFIFATGDKKINETFLEIKYKDYSNILLTNKAAAYPLKYKDKRKEFHPYTVARTMRNGWRWITPTWSRIGTGYVFSNNHISEDQAIEELRDNIGDKKVEPFLVDFHPKHNPQEIHRNWATLGMASGFVEPLDAPGLSMTINSVMYQLGYYIEFLSSGLGKERIEFEIDKVNDVLNNRFDFWCYFILSQYKTCIREDTPFWKDQKNIKWEKYDDFIKNLDEYNPSIEKLMLYHTLAAKDFYWKTSLKSKPITIDPIYFVPRNHLDLLEDVHKYYEQGV